MDMVRPLPEMMPGQANPLRILVESSGKLKGNLRRLSCPHAVKKSFVAVEAGAPVPQTDSGRLG